MKKKLKLLFKKHEDEEKGFNDSIMNVQDEREEKSRNEYERIWEPGRKSLRSCCPCPCPFELRLL